MRPFILTLLCLLSFSAVASDKPRAASTNSPTLNYMLIVTGEELLRGAFPDTHTSFITRTLHLMGGHCVGSIMVDDRADDIRDALQFAAKRAKLILITGGLGPTVNDGTREAVSDFTGVKLAEHPEALEQLERRLKQGRETFRPNMRRQALAPTRGTFLKNPHGTAVGLVFDGDGATIVALPGPPRELQPMVTSELVPFLRKKFGVLAPGSSLTLRFVGIGQSQIDQTMRQHVPAPRDLVTGSVFEAGRVDFVFALPGDSAADRLRLKNIESALLKHLGEFLYANDGTSLEALIVKRLQSRGNSLVLAEIGSGGHLAASLSAAHGVEQLLKTAYVSPTDERMRQTLEISEMDWSAWKPGAERATGLARAARKRAGGSFVVAITETTAGADGKSSVWMAFGGEGELNVQLVPMQGTGELAHANLVTQILDRLRRHLK